MWATCLEVHNAAVAWQHSIHNNMLVLSQN